MGIAEMAALQLPPYSTRQMHWRLTRLATSMFPIEITMSSVKYQPPPVLSLPWQVMAQPGHRAITARQRPHHCTNRMALQLTVPVIYTSLIVTMALFAG